MTTTRNPLQDFILTPQQQTLLFAALNSNRPSANANNSPSSYNDSPVQKDLGSFQESPYLDYDFEFGNSSGLDFDFSGADQPKMIGDLPGPDSSKSDSPENESPDKRSHPDDDDDEAESPKRRESGEVKVPKKPGRKPLTSEPSSKRKAQNRAAQRAFRERKEKHLKDLETKVEELEKASKSANSENAQLRAQLDKMTVELTEYKKRVSLLSSSRPSLPPSARIGRSMLSNLGDVSFQFEFPKFGALPGPAGPSLGANGVNGSGLRSPSASKSPQLERDQLSPLEKPAKAGSISSTGSHYTSGLDAQTKEDLAGLSGFFTPLTNNNAAPVSRTSLDSHYSGAPTTTSSPASSNSNPGTSSSCGTSPEPFSQSPTSFKPVELMSTIGEEQPASENNSQDFGHFASIDMNDISWLASQNNFQFDPQLFGDYREPQDSVLTNGGIEDSFFNDALNVDFLTPYNVAPSPAAAAAAKKDQESLIAKIDAAKEADDQVDSEGRLLTCNKIWYDDPPTSSATVDPESLVPGSDDEDREKLQKCQRVQNGDFDLDGLCSDLQKKAKCSGSGAVVNEQDFKNVMKKYLGKTDEEMKNCNVD